VFIYGARAEQTPPFRYHGVSAGVRALRLFFVNDTATTEIYTLSLHDALPIWSQPHFFSIAAWPSVSTPSAVMVTCSDCPRPTMLDTMADVCGLVPSVSMKERSILIFLTGKRVR